MHLVERMATKDVTIVAVRAEKTYGGAFVRFRSDVHNVETVATAIKEHLVKEQPRS